MSNTKNKVISYLDENDAVFLPGKIHGCDWQLYIIYYNGNANEGKGSFEIEIVDAERVLQIYLDVKKNAEAFFDELPERFQGEWYYTDAGEELFKEYTEQFSGADFIVGRDGGKKEEMLFLVKWALSVLEKDITESEDSKRTTIHLDSVMIA